MKSKEFEDILHGVGSFGPFQVMVFIVVSLFETPAAWAMFLPVFIHRQVRWVCKNDTYHDKFNDTETNKTWSDGMNRSNCNRCPESERQYLDDFTSIVSEVSIKSNALLIRFPYKRHVCVLIQNYVSLLKERTNSSKQ